MRRFVLLCALLASPVTFAQRYVEIKCPSTYDASLKLERGFSTFRPATAADAAQEPTGPAALAGAEVYVGEPATSPPLKEENASAGSDATLWYMPGPKIIACRYAGIETRVYRMIYPPANECTAPRTPTPGKPLVVRCRTR